jgi:hypothetical protein
MNERDIWQVASQMIELFDDAASEYAAIRADALAEEGDQEGYVAWRRVLRAILELNRKQSQGPLN